MINKYSIVIYVLLVYLAMGQAIAGGETGKFKISEARENLEKFAQANCLFWHFKEKGYDTNDIRAISGGYVEMGSSSAEVYQEIALSVKSFQTDRKTKQNIDPSLLKCFHLEDNQELKNIIDNATSK